jgi:hypothetical protein
MAAPMMLSVSPDAFSNKGCMFSTRREQKETESFFLNQELRCKKVEPGSYPKSVFISVLSVCSCSKRLAILILPTTSWPKVQAQLTRVTAAVDALRPGDFVELNFS